MKLLYAVAIPLCLLAAGLRLAGCGPVKECSITIHFKDGKEIKYDNIHSVTWGDTVFTARRHHTRQVEIVCIIPLDAISWIDEGNTTATRTD